FPQNKQNENAITRDPFTGALVVGANDEIGLNLCKGTTVPLASPCPFTPGASVSGFYRSTDGGGSWSGGLLPGGSGYVPGGDPSLDYGPRQCADASFSWACGVVIYYASLGDPFPEFSGEQVLINRSYDDGATWSAPSLATSTDKKSNFDDHEWIAVDRSPAHFGRLYLFWAVYCNTCSGNGNVKLYVAHSDDEGRTFTSALKAGGTAFNLVQGQRETGQLAVSSTGIVEAFWPDHADSKGKYPTTQVVAVSTDGGDTFAAPIPISQVTDYPLMGTPFDVVDLFNRVPGMSARVDCYPHPAADPSSPRVYVVWCDFSGVVGVVKAAYSTDGVSWTNLGTIASVPGRNAFFPAVAVAPSGTVAVTFDALTAPPADDLWSTGTQLYDNYYVESINGGASFSPPMRVSSTSSNPDTSSYNNLMEQFIGDYIDIVAGPARAYLVWTDARDASRCQAVDDYRNAVYAGSKTAVAPNPDIACATNFGNTDTEFAPVGY
ncbi:MAG: glycoside hydrolase, partial [Actinomycetota bacterium]|nr:glycoside hydrolase [Actinomycetota bacterium]